MSSAEARRLRRFQQKVAGVPTRSGKGTTSGTRGYAGGGHPGRLLENLFPSTRFVAWDGESVTIPPDQLELQSLGEELWRAQTAVDAAKEAIGSDPWADAWRSRRRGQRFADRLGLGEDEYEVAVERHGVLRQELALERRRARRLALDLERAQVSTHSYVLLMSSAGDELVQPTGAALSTAECLSLLCDAAERQATFPEKAEFPRTVNVAYGGNYDVVKILADLRRKDIQTLWERPVIDVGGRRIIKPVHWRPRATTWDPDPLWFRIEYTPRSCLKVARQAPERWARDKAGKLVLGPSGFPKKVWGKTFVLWDVIKFFQTTFVNAVEEWLGDLPELEMVRTQKKRRATFTLDELEREIIPYTRVEVELLARVMERLRDALVEARVPIARWDGVGAIAAALMHREGIPGHMPRAGLRGEERHLETIPEPVQVAAQHAYFGGRIELLKYGRIPGPIHHYDINSAYPAVYPSLPSLHEGAGDWVQGDRRSAFSVSRVRWHPHEAMTTSKVFPFPFRDVLGNILFPATWGNPLEGWYWRPEVDAALELSDLSIELLETWSWVEHAPVRPFGYVQELYDLRMRVGKKTGTGRVVKLGLNAHSGKTAQSAGWQTHGHVPQLHCTPWAGYITSATRAQLYRAAMQAPDAIIAISTDGVWSQVPLDLPISKRLGDWEYACHDELVCAQSGVYWTRDGDAWRVHCRGYDLEDHATGEPVVTREGVLEAWERGARSLPAQCTRFIGFGSALAGPRQWSRRGTFWTATRELQLDPAGTKRRALPGVWRPAEGPVPTAPRDPGEALGDQAVLTSRIYPLGWRGEEWGVRDREDGVPSAVWVAEVEDTLL